MHLWCRPALRIELVAVRCLSILAPKASTDQLPIRPATQSRTKAACAPPASPGSREPPLTSQRTYPQCDKVLSGMYYQAVPVTEHYRHRPSIGQAGASQPAVCPWGRGLPRRGPEGPREAAIVPFGVRRARRRLGGFWGRVPEGSPHPFLALRPIQKRKGLRAAREVPRTTRSATRRRPVVVRRLECRLIIHCHRRSPIWRQKPVQANCHFDPPPRTARRLHGDN